MFALPLDLFQDYESNLPRMFPKFHATHISMDQAYKLVGIPYIGCNGSLPRNLEGSAANNSWSNLSE